MDKKIISIPLAIMISFTLMALFFVVLFSRLPPQIPLFYSVSDGEDAVVDTLFIFLLPAITLLIVSFNSLLKKKYFDSNPLLDHIFYYCNLIIILASTLIFLRIIFLVT